MQRYRFPRTSTFRPSTFSSRSGKLSARRSTTPFMTASTSVMDTAFGDRLRGPLFVPAPFLGDAFNVGDHVVHDLVFHGLVHVFTAAADGHRGSRADVGPRRHGRDMGRHGDHDSRGSRPGAARRHVDDDRHGESIWSLPSHAWNRPTRRGYPARLPGLPRLFGLAFMDGPLQKLGRSRIDDPVDTRDIDHRGLGLQRNVQPKSTAPGRPSLQAPGHVFSSAIVAWGPLTCK